MPGSIEHVKANLPPVEDLRPALRLIVALDALRKAQQTGSEGGARPRGHFAQAAFKGPDGTIYPSGPFHSSDALPNEDMWHKVTDGFLGHDGKFYDRKQAAAKIAAAAPGHWQREKQLHSDNVVTGEEAVHGAGAALDELASGRPHPAGFGLQKLQKSDLMRGLHRIKALRKSRDWSQLEVDDGPQRQTPDLNHPQIRVIQNRISRMGYGPGYTHPIQPRQGGDGWLHGVDATNPTHIIHHDGKIVPVEEQRRQLEVDNEDYRMAPNHPAIRNAISDAKGFNTPMYVGRNSRDRQKWISTHYKWRDASHVVHPDGRIEALGETAAPNTNTRGALLEPGEAPADIEHNELQPAVPDRRFSNLEPDTDPRPTQHQRQNDVPIEAPKRNLVQDLPRLKRGPQPTFEPEQLQRIQQVAQGTTGGKVYLMQDAHGNGWTHHTSRPQIASHVMHANGSIHENPDALPGAPAAWQARVESADMYPNRTMYLSNHQGMPYHDHEPDENTTHVLHPSGIVEPYQKPVSEAKIERLPHGRWPLIAGPRGVAEDLDWDLIDALRRPEIQGNADVARALPRRPRHRGR